MKIRLINFYIFAMRNKHYHFVNINTQSFLTNHKGIVPNSFYRKVDCLFRNLRGLYPHFLKVNYFLMRNKENNLQQTHEVCSAVTSNSRNELPQIQDLFNSTNSKLFTVTATRNYCYIRFKPESGKFFRAKAKTFAEAYTSLIDTLTTNNIVL